jgi:hypothetical protein
MARTTRPCAAAASCAAAISAGLALVAAAEKAKEEPRAHERSRPPGEGSAPTRPNDASGAAENAARGDAGWGEEEADREEARTNAARRATRPTPEAVTLTAWRTHMASPRATAKDMERCVGAKTVSARACTVPYPHE